MKTKLLLLLLLLPLSLSSQLWQPVEHEFDSIMSQLDISKSGNFDIPNANKSIQRLQAISFQHPKNNVMKWRTMYWKAELLRARGEDAKSERLATMALAMVDSVKYPYDWHRIDWITTAVNFYRINNISCYNKLQERLKFFESVKDTIYMANTYIYLGLLLQDLNMYEKALEYTSMAEKLYLIQNNNINACKSRLNKVNSLISLGKENKAKTLLKSLVENEEMKKDTIFYVAVLNSISTFFKDTSKYEWSCREAYRLSSLLGINSNFYRSLVNMGSLFLVKEKPDSAKKFFNEALQYSIKEHIDQVALPSVTGMAYSYAMLRQYDSAYYYMDSLMVLRNAIENSTRVEEIQKMETRVLIEQQDEQLAMIRAKARAERISWIAMIAVVIVIACATGYSLWAKRAKSHAMLSLVATKLENEELRSALLQQKTEENARELASKELLLNKSQNVMERLEKQIDEGRRGGDISGKSAISLKSEISMNMTTEKRWESFFVQFNQIHPNFFDNLIKICPSLTKGEQRICAFIRVGLSNKEIAELLAIQHESVKIAGYRIRKKLQLKTVDSLETFLMHISTTG